LVLAAGAGSRYSDEPGTKLLADIDGEPLLSHVLAAVRAFGPVTSVVVLGHNADAIEQAIDWHDEIRVRNHAPGRGLASSLQIGIDTLRALPLIVDGVFIVLGDQPLLDVAVMQALARAATPEQTGSRSGERSLIAPTYAGQPGPRNPVLLMRSAWHLVDEISGDRGLSQLMAEHPHLVLDVPVAGHMPDVDRPEDLAAVRDAPMGR
jgi:molybdenum cofactor cytidylyltransferase